MVKLGKYSIGMGDRFGHQGSAQLKAVIEAGKKGIEITPVWNKSNREHLLIGTHPSDVRIEADSAIDHAGFKKSYFVDADHINIDTVDRFIESSDFFTVDVASYIGKRADNSEIDIFLKRAKSYSGRFEIPGIKRKMKCSVKQLSDIADNYLFAIKKAGEIYRKIENSKGTGNFITEVSMDEVARPQTSYEIFFILCMLSIEGVPLQTIAPKFSGRFNKGIDYAGNPEEFSNEFEEDLLAVAYAVREFGLAENLKISIHSGSDKFSIYPYIKNLLAVHNKGVHLKTAGTTWLEEVIGLAETGGEALDFVKNLYTCSLGKIEELCIPYSDVIDINEALLPSAGEVSAWNGSTFAASLRHEPGNILYNPSMRQLMHIAYKLAAEKIDDFHRLLNDHQDIISKCVFENLYNRHICRIFEII